MMTIKVNNIDLSYEVSGLGAPIILLHGNGETHHIFDRIIKPLSAHFTIYAIDLRGHGESSPITDYHYSDMADDIYEFIKVLKIDKPILYGFSDGGIIGILLASRYPDLLSRLMVSGVNISPKGLKNGWHILFKIQYLLNSDQKIGMMLKEPNISPRELHAITTPTLLLVGSNDVIKKSHTKLIFDNIYGAVLQIVQRETHGSYVVNSDKLYPIIKQFCLK